VYYISLGIFLENLIHRLLKLFGEKKIDELPILDTLQMYVIFWSRNSKSNTNIFPTTINLC